MLLAVSTIALTFRSEETGIRYLDCLPTRLDAVKRLAVRVFLLAASAAITTIIMIGHYKGIMFCKRL